MGNNYIYNVKTPVNNDQGAKKSYVDSKVAKAGGTMSGVLDMNNNKIINTAESTNNGDVVNKAYIENGFLKLTGCLMTGNVNTVNNRIYNLPTPRKMHSQQLKGTQIDTNFLKLSGGTLTGALYLKTTAQVTHDEALNVTTATAYFVQVHNPYAYTRFNMTNHKIINLAHPTNATDGVYLKTLNKHIIKPSDHTNRFAYLMAPTTCRSPKME